MACQFRKLASLADIAMWKRTLHPIEIRAIYEQKTTIEKVS
ncbi:unnamed protein product, partial [Didymodactylos carnosus]